MENGISDHEDAKFFKLDNGDDVRYVEKLVGTRDFLVYNENGDLVTWGMPDDAFVEFLENFGRCTCEPVDFEQVNEEVA